MQNEDTELAKHSAASHAQSTSCKTISDSPFACPPPCVPRALPILLGKSFQRLSEPGQGSSASSHPGIELLRFKHFLEFMSSTHSLPGARISPCASRPCRFLQLSSCSGLICPLPSACLAWDPVLEPCEP